MLDIIQKPNRLINLKKSILLKEFTTKSDENVMLEPDKVFFQNDSLPKLSHQPLKYNISIEIEKPSSFAEEQNNLLEQQRDESKCLYVIYMIHVIFICLHVGIFIFVLIRYLHKTE